MTPSASLPSTVRVEYTDPLAEFTLDIGGHAGEGRLSPRELMLAVPPAWSWAVRSAESVPGLRIAEGVLRAPAVNLPAVVVELVGLTLGGAKRSWVLSLRWRSGGETTVESGDAPAAVLYRALVAAIAPLGPLSEVRMPAGLVPDGATDPGPATVLVPGVGLAPDTRVPETMAQPFAVEDPSTGVVHLASVAFDPSGQRDHRPVAEPSPQPAAKPRWRRWWSERRARRGS